MRYLHKQRDGQAEGWLKLHRARRYPRPGTASAAGPDGRLTRSLKPLVDADAPPDRQLGAQPEIRGRGPARVVASRQRPLQCCLPRLRCSSLSSAFHNAPDLQW